MTPVTVRYANGTAAVFASEADALEQSAHDLSFPGHVDPVHILEGDHSEVHARWREQLIADRVIAAQEAAVEGEPPAPIEPVAVTVDPPASVVVLRDREAVAALECSCVECEFQRRAPATHPLERRELREMLEIEAKIRAMDPDSRTRVEALLNG